MLGYLVSLLFIQPNIETPEKPKIGSEYVQQIIVDVGVAKGLNEAEIGQILRVVACESQYRNVQSDIIDKNGNQEDSWGIVQIHLPSNPEITKDQALDIEFAVDFITEAWLTGDQWKWTCFRKIYGVN